MLKKILLGVGVLMVVLVAGLFFWARAIFASETVRVAVEGQLTRALGQPVRIGRMGATVLPRVTMTLHDVRIGEPARITAGRLDVGTALRALLSRRIEHGSIRLDKARIELPLPAFAAGGDAAPAGASAGAPVEIVSIDSIALDDVEIVSGRRTLRGDIEMAIAGRRLEVTRGDFTADGTAIGLTGRIDDSSGPTGEVTIRAPSLDLLQLLSFVSDFSAGGTSPGTSRHPRAAAAPDPVPMNLTVSLQTDRVTLGSLVLTTLAGRARVTDEAVTLDPITFGTFGGTAKGSLVLTLADTPNFRLGAALAGVDLAALTAFAGHPDLVTGRLAGRLDVNGRGTSADLVMRSTAGTARIDATDGTVKGLGLVRAVVLAGSMREGSLSEATSGSATEPYNRLGATFTLAGGTASTSDLRFESKDVLLDAVGSFRLDGSDVNLAGQMQLSEALSAQAGRDLVRYTADQGRVTLPATIRGTAERLQVRVDTTKLFKRAITNRASEEIKKGLGRLFGGP
jgi:uncharacterized protein involved in outer membrane biogenesis